MTRMIIRAVASALILACAPAALADQPSPLEAAEAVSRGFPSLADQFGLDGALDMLAIDYHPAVGQALGLGDMTETLGLTEEEAMTVSRVWLACAATLNAPPGLCSCITTRAIDDFEEPGLNLLSVIMIGDEARVDELRSEVSFSTFTRAATYLVEVPPTCVPN